MKFLNLTLMPKYLTLPPLPELERTHPNHRAVNSLLIALLVMDFFVRGHLWAWIKGDWFFRYGLYACGWTGNEDAAYRCYWICDSITYAIAYGTLALLTKGMRIHVVMVASFPFAFNKVVESVLTDKSQWDWTEYVALMITIIIVWKKLIKK